MLVFRLALRALRWRAAASATVFTVALVAVVAAALGPIYLRAVDDSLLRTRLTATSPATRDVHISRNTLDGVTGFDWTKDVDALAEEAAAHPWFAPAVHTAEGQVVYTRRGGSRYAGQLASVDGLCAHLRIVSGRCVRSGAVDETVLTARSARAMHVGVGQVVKPVPASGGVVPVALRVVGVAEPADPAGRYWTRFPLLTFAPTLSDAQLPRLDSFLVAPAALSGRIESLVQTIAVDVPLRPDRVRLGDLPALRAAIKELQADGAARSRGTLTPITIGSRLNTALDGMHKEMSLSRTLIVLPTLQLVLLAIFVLYAVVASTTGVQAPEVALAKLRGRRPRSVLAQGVLQPVLLIVLAAPVGALLAWVLVRAVAGHVLHSDVGIAFPLSAVGAVAAAVGGGVLASVAAARRIVISPVGALLRRGTDATSSSVGLAVADAAAVVLAGAGLVELLAGGVLNSGDTNPLSALAPTLLALAAAVIVLRLLPFAGRGLVRATRDSRRLATFLAVRQIVRRPSTARALVAVAVAVALATFAVTNWSVARTNREQRALNAVGAETVLTVTVPETVADLRGAVKRADPSGHSMAAAVVRTGGTPLLAVDTARFAGVAAWRPSYSSTPLSALLPRLGRAGTASMAFRGTRLQLSARLAALPHHRVHLGLYVTGADHRQTLYDLGMLPTGASTHEVALAPSCRTRCRVTGLALSADTTGSAGADSGEQPQIQVGLAARALTGGRWVPVGGFTEPARWRSDPAAGLRAGDGRLAVTVSQVTPGGDWPVLRSADVPGHLPAVFATRTAENYPGPAVHDASAPNLDGQSLPLDGFTTAVTLPELDRDGAMVDLGAALRAMTSPVGGGVRQQVWLGPGAPKNMPARLAAQGIKVTGVSRAADHRRALDRTGPAYAGGLFLVAAGTAALLALGAAVLGGIITARRRAYELAALATVGVGRPVLRRATAAEQGIVLGGGLLVGLAAGVLGSRLALPSTPFFVNEDVGPPSEHAVPWGLLGLLIAGVAVVFAVTCVVVGRLVAAQATAARLREAQQ